LPSPLGFRSVDEMVLLAGLAPTSGRLEGGCLGLLGYRSNETNGRAPRCCPGLLLVPSEAGSMAPSRAIKHVEIGGLCGLCSRDLPLDKRLLFVAELTGLYIIERVMKWCGVWVMLPVVP
jgi:hypothetical protein